MTTETSASPPLMPTLYFLSRDLFKIGRKERRRQSQRRFDELLTDPKVHKLAIDCGANVGMITGKLVDAGFRVHAFEPDPEARAALNARMFPKDKVEIHPVAVGVRSYTATLFRGRKKGQKDIHTPASTLVDYRKTAGADNVEVKVVDLIDFIDKLSERVGILKLDIEGSEVEVLNALIDRNLHRKIDFIVAETHERFNADLAWRTAALRARVASSGIENINLDHP